MIEFKVGDKVRIKTEDKENNGPSLVAQVFSKYLKDHSNILTISDIRPIPGTEEGDEVVYLDFDEFTEKGFYSTRFELISSSFNATEEDLEGLLNDQV